MLFETWNLIQMVFEVVFFYKKWNRKRLWQYRCLHFRQLLNFTMKKKIWRKSPIFFWTLCRLYNVNKLQMWVELNLTKAHFTKIIKHTLSHTMVNNRYICLGCCQHYVLMALTQNLKFTFFSLSSVYVRTNQLEGISKSNATENQL